MHHNITALTDHETGAEVRGLDLSQRIDDSLRREINQALARYHVLVFREQKLSPPEFAQAARNFGEIMLQQDRAKWVPGHPEISHLMPTEIEPGRYLIDGEGFHTDHSWDPCPPKATALHPVALPATGGDTQFVNMHMAYDDLPQDTKRRIDGLRAMHTYSSKHRTREILALSEESAKALPPPSSHALVRTHPDNGRKFLYLNPVRMESIVGMDDAAALALIAELMAHATRQKFEYRQKWQPGDMVIWDNRSVMHKANGDYDMTKRHMYRVMVKSDPAAERALNSAAG